MVLKPQIYFKHTVLAVLTFVTRYIILKDPGATIWTYSEQCDIFKRAMFLGKSLLQDRADTLLM